MKKTILNILLITAIAPFIVQCASQTDVDQLHYQLRIVNKKLEEMKSTTVDQLQKRQAVASGQVDQLEKDILKLQSQLEETYHLNQRLKEQNKELQETITSVAQQEAEKRQEAMRKMEEMQLEKEARLASELNEKLRLQEESVKAIQEARVKEAERRAREAAIAAQLAKTRSAAANKGVESTGPIRHIQATKSKVKRSVVAPAVTPVQQEQASDLNASSQPESTQSASPKETPLAAAAGAADSFQQAQSLYQKNKYDEALNIFDQIAGDPSSSNGVTARFMMGECLFNLKEYDKAIMQYQKIISQHGNNEKAPLAMLKQGMAFERLADKDTAKVIYKKLLKQHGDSPEATEAQEHLDKL